MTTAWNLLISKQDFSMETPDAHAKDEVRPRKIKPSPGRVSTPRTRLGRWGPGYGFQLAPR